MYMKPEILKHAPAYFLLAIIWGAVTFAGEVLGFTWPAYLFFLVSSLGYVLFAGISLWFQEHTQWFTKRWGEEDGFNLFKSICSVIMINLGVAHVIVVWLTGGISEGNPSLTGLLDSVVSVPTLLRIGIGVVLVIIGFWAKAAAQKALDDRDYYWHDFFGSPDDTGHTLDGIYNWFSNPMYTIGYAHAYGVAIVFDSLIGLFAAAFMQAGIMSMWWLVERPHYERIYGDQNDE